ncbi:hypothetical protein ANO14919_143080 [Xylariales sp. No.14919]|nr:hypothetical protein ANO14919_143080 [Xylariales sp. No.14919]
MAGDSAYSVSRSGSDDCLSHFVQERGSLRVSGGTQSRFTGSSSGVYFVNTVRQAVARSCGRLPSHVPEDPGSNPSPEDCIATDEDNDDAGAGRGADNVPRRPEHSQANAGASPSLSGLPIERPPARDAARILFMTYFQTWHRFFPFVQGPVVGKDLEILYSDGTEFSRTMGASADPTCGQTLPAARLVILQCLFNLAALHSDVDLPAESRIHHPIHLLPHLIGDATKGDIVSIQALFAVELLLVARMSLRPAATVAGLLSRLIFLAGLHRCPVRYAEISTDQADIRKRLFWCIYVLDRFLSQALGHPLGILDSDIDVCLLSGPELHHRSFPSADAADRTSAATLSGDPQSSSGSHGNRKVPGRDAQGSVDDHNLILASQVDYFRLMGRSLELFHKSIHVRFIDHGTVLSLRTALETFWNSLPSDLQDLSTGVEETQSRQRDCQVFNTASFFSLLHNHLRLLLYRPWLSLEPSSRDFQSALQTCIGVSRDIIFNTKRQRSFNYALFWPGHLSAIWMAGIILVFASHLQLYPADKSQMEIGLCLDALESISYRWPLARNCHVVLSDLHRAVQKERLYVAN